VPTITILVEDSKTIRDALMPSMAELGNMEVLGFAETASDAIALLQENESVWQLAVVDLFLREGTGLNVLRACRNRRPDQHVVMLSNYTHPDMRQRCRDLGADAIFDKSTELEAFFEYCHALGSR
jgi:DNA-binding NarL/FixJ family response regulator